MIITRTPFRISLFGGGTDYPAYYKDHQGAVLNTTIDKYCYITCRYLPPFFDHRFRIRYTTREETQTVSEIRHPSVRECLRFVRVDEGIEMVHTSDIPAMSGIGSSSAFTVGFLHALYALQGRMVTKRKLALDAIHVEQDMIREHVGSQDQTAAAFGGFNKIEFSNSDGIRVQPVVIDRKKLQYLQDSLLLFFIGQPRFASNIAQEQIKQTPNRLNELHTMRQIVDEAVTILNTQSDWLNDFGKLLHESWMLKRSLTTRITNDKINEIYETARAAGALGGKLCGAGGGGFMLFLVPPQNIPKVKEALKKLLLVPFRFDTLGSHIVYYTDIGHPSSPYAKAS